MSKQDKVATMLDPHLCNCTHLNDMQRIDAREVFITEYTTYANRASSFEYKMATHHAATLSDRIKKEITTTRISAEKEDLDITNPALAKKSSGFSDDSGSETYSSYSDENSVRKFKTDSEWRAEAKTVHKNWRKFSKQIKWEKLCASLIPRANEIKKNISVGKKDGWNIVSDLLTVSLKSHISKVKLGDKDRKSFGYLPYMAKTWLGRLMAESFSERMLSNAKIVINPGNMRLNPIEMEQLVILRMNRKFMQYMKLKYPEKLKAFLAAMNGERASAKESELEADDSYTINYDDVEVSIVEHILGSSS